ncbi:hypothetical protein LZ31DRAFT_182654 [Colletotrichum somersetense]|nr:hypothetical protein LZ31DRAFT_182654 [Colletotrichum somersetense]
MKVALPIYRKMAIRNSEVTPGGDALRDVACDGLETVSDVHTARIETSVRERSFENVPPADAHIESDDLILVSSRALTDGPSRMYEDRGEKRSLSRDAAQHRVPKRARLCHPAGSEVGILLTKEDIQPLGSGYGLSREIVRAALRVIECAIGSQLAIVDPATPQAFKRFTGRPGKQHLIPLLHEDHWSLGVMGANQDVLRVYDPQPSPENCRVVEEKVAGSSPAPQVIFIAPLLQDREEDSGLLLILSVFYVSVGLQLPQDADLTFWRTVVHMILTPSSEDEVGVVQSYRIGQPLVLRSNPDPVAITGGNIDIGQVSLPLTLMEAQDLYK